jgi:ribosome-associated heat shock protein Hsp15
MRIDSLLKALCLVKTRSMGRKGCLAGSVKLNGSEVKPSREAEVGDIVEIRYPGRVLVIELIDVPSRQAARKDCGEYYRIVRESRLE